METARVRQKKIFVLVTGIDLFYACDRFPWYYLPITKPIDRDAIWCAIIPVALVALPAIALWQAFRSMWWDTYRMIELWRTNANNKKYGKH